MTTVDRRLEFKANQDREKIKSISIINFFKVISRVEMHVFILRSCLHMYELKANSLVIKCFFTIVPFLFHFSDLRGLHLLKL